MRYCLTSAGLWKQKKDLQVLFPESKFIISPLASLANPDIYVGWGNKKSGIMARQLAKKHQKQFRCLEDGFLRSYKPGNHEASASYVIDDLGIYYDCHQESRLEALIKTGITDPNLLKRSSLAISEIQSSEISKYNNNPDKSLASMGVSSSKPYVLLLDQVPGDASIMGANADQYSFHTMLKDAHTDWPNHQILVRSHPAATITGELEKAAKFFPSTIILKERSNLWPLLKGADHVYTVSSQSGFEALLCGKEVSCYGMPFYAGWGLTIDKSKGCDAVISRRNCKRSISQVFAAAYIKYTKYLDLHERYPTTLENTIDALNTIKTSRSKNSNAVITVGMSKWKRRAVEPFLIGSGGKPLHISNLNKAPIVNNKDAKTDIVVWGADTEINLPNKNTKLVRMEDGFLRSVGLGAALHFPTSLVRETSDYLYFDARGSSNLEKIIHDCQLDEKTRYRTQQLQKSLIDNSITKYMLKSKASIIPEKPDQLKILVTGQVSDDASIRYGASDIKSNTDLIAKVRNLYPDAFIAYREHPDVEKGLRKGKADRSLANYNANEADLLDLINWCDRVETITSLSGFEALIRGKPVGVHGWPFYAGWGLTEDRLDKALKGNIDLETLIASTFIIYPDYIHPKSELPCTPERVIKALTEQRTRNEDKYFISYLKSELGIFIGKAINKLK